MEFKTVCQATNLPSSQITKDLNEVPIKVQPLSLLIGPGRWQAAATPAFPVSLPQTLATNNLPLFKEVWQ